MRYSKTQNITLSLCQKMKKKKVFVHSFQSTNDKRGNVLIEKEWCKQTLYSSQLIVYLSKSSSSFSPFVK